MNLFYMQPERDGVLPMPIFLKDNYIGFDWPGIGDLEHVGREEWQELAVHTCLEQGQALLDRLTEIGLFVYAMQDGDYLLVADGEYVHLGDLGDYYYVESAGQAEDIYSHRRGVTWLKRMLKAELHAELQPLAGGQANLARLDRPVSQELLEKWTAKPAHEGHEASRMRHVDDETIAEALEILKKAMKSKDLERKERAAIAILRFAK
ncbi:hypothetical protein [Paenibacillus paridis]|uniref:hypothetical protein n=1 Tax=Paenibacillus paridis TaxID=2583376 RepID=UPI00111CA676|nr:hypothetical protein [Paenibacillus paridis]